jgi:DNA-directed RNA polymerase subunit RPC12/RpoP
MPKFAFEITMTTSAIVEDKTLEKAIARLRKLPGLDVTVASQFKGKVEYTGGAQSAEGRLKTIELYKVDHYQVGSFGLYKQDEQDSESLVLQEEFVCRFCGKNLRLNSELAVFEDHGYHPPRSTCPDRDEPDQPHVPWVVYHCQNCTHEAREDEFLPSDGSDSYRCAKCGSTDVFVAFEVPLETKESK